MRRLPPELRGRTRRRRPAPSRPACRRGPSAGRRRSPSPSRGRRPTRSRVVGGRAPGCRSRKSLWITQLRDVVGLVLVEPGHHPLVVADVVGAARCGTGRTSRRPGARRTRRPCRGRRARRGAGVDRCRSTSTSSALRAQRAGLRPRRASTPGGQVAPRDGARRAAPSRRSPSRSPPRRRRTPTIVGDVAGRPARAPTGCGTRGPCRARPWPSCPPAAGAGSGRGRGSAAGRSGSRRRRGNCRTSGVPPARSVAVLARARPPPPRRRTRPRRGPRAAPVDRQLTAPRHLRPACARLVAHHARRTPPGRRSLSAYAAPGRLVGDDQLVAARRCPRAPPRRCRRR